MVDHGCSTRITPRGPSSIVAGLWSSSIRPHTTDARRRQDARPQPDRGSSPSPIPPANSHLDGTTAQATADNSSPTGASLNALSATLPRPSTDPCTRSGALHSTSRQALPRSLGVCACSSSRPLPPSGLPARALWPSPALRPISRPRRTPGVSSGWRGRSMPSRR